MDIANELNSLMLAAQVRLEEEEAKVRLQSLEESLEAKVTQARAFQKEIEDNHKIILGNARVAATQGKGSYKFSRLEGHYHSEEGKLQPLFEILKEKLLAAGFKVGEIKVRYESFMTGVDEWEENYYREMEVSWT